MKKITSSIKSPAPATKPAVAKRAPASPSTARTRLKSAPSPAAVVVISARIDVGFGNSLYLRGEGSGLDWERGLPLENRSADLWSISLPASAAPLRFKFLINDVIWSAGEDYSAVPGAEVTLTPQF